MVHVKHQLFVIYLNYQLIPFKSGYSGMDKYREIFLIYWEIFEKSGFFTHKALSKNKKYEFLFYISPF